jgi:ubiquinone/menaquinone biosynthesis C-methylase UbiE
MKKPFQKLFADPSKIEYWESVYDRQDFYGDCIRQRMSKALSWLDGLRLSENSSILDAGCGAGRLAHEAAKRGYHVFGMDYSYGMLVKASSFCNREDRHNVKPFQGDIESVPLQDSSFDVIICLGVISYLKSEEEALLELARILKPGGVLVLSITNKARLVSRMDLPLLLKNRVQKILTSASASWKKSAGIDNVPRLTTYSIPNIQKSLELAGFTVLEYGTIPLELLTLFGREVLPRKTAIKIILFFEQFSNIPIIGSFGGMCMFKAKKNSLKMRESGY